MARLIKANPRSPIGIIDGFERREVDKQQATEREREEQLAIEREFDMRYNNPALWADVMDKARKAYKGN